MSVFLEDVVWHRGEPATLPVLVPCRFCGRTHHVEVSVIFGSQWIGVGEGTFTGISAEAVPSACPDCGREYDEDRLADEVADALHEYREQLR